MDFSKNSVAIEKYSVNGPLKMHNFSDSSESEGEESYDWRDGSSSECSSESD